MKSKKLLSTWIANKKLSQNDIVKCMPKVGFKEVHIGENNVSIWTGENSNSFMPLDRALQLNKSYMDFPLLDYYEALLEDAETYPDNKVLSGYAISANVLSDFLEVIDRFKSEIFKIVQDEEERWGFHFPNSLGATSKQILTDAIAQIVEVENEAYHETSTN